MPQITSITSQKKAKDRVNVFVDGEFSFATDLETILKYKLSKGRVLEQKDIQGLKHKDEEAKHFNAVLNFLSFRPRSEKEIRDYLTKKIAKTNQVKFHEAKENPTVNKLLVKLRKYKLVDDREFVNWFMRARNSKAKGKLLIKMELVKKGIDKELIDQQLENLKDDSKLARTALSKKLLRWKSLPLFKQKQKAWAFLASHGFNRDTIEEVFASLFKKS